MRTLRFSGTSLVDHGHHQEGESVHRPSGVITIATKIQCFFRGLGGAGGAGGNDHRTHCADDDH